MMGEQEGIICSKGYAEPLPARFDWCCPDLPSIDNEPNMLLSTCARRRLRGGGCFGVACSAFPGEPRGPRGCDIAGCEEGHVAKGLCYRHYWDKQKTLRRAKSATRAKKIKGCGVVGCDGKHYAKGFCSKHYRSPRQLASGSVVNVLKCTLPGCSDDHYRSGFCRSHFYQAHRQKSGLTLKLFKISIVRGVSPADLLNLLADGGC